MKAIKQEDCRAILARLVVIRYCLEIAPMYADEIVDILRKYGRVHSQVKHEFNAMDNHVRHVYNYVNECFADADKMTMLAEFDPLRESIDNLIKDLVNNINYIEAEEGLKDE